MTTARPRTKLPSTWAPTRNLALLEELIIKLKKRDPNTPGIGVFYGRSGDGKSRAAAWMAAGEHMAYCVEANAFWTTRVMLDAIIDAMGLAVEKHASNQQRAKVIAEELEKSRRPLIIDEGDHIAKADMIDKVRALHDMAAPGTATLIIVGEEALPQRLQRFERFHGRVFDWIAAQPCDIEDARRLAELYCSKVEVADDLLEMLVERTYGSTRRMTTNLVNVATFAAGEQLGTVTAEHYQGQVINTGAAPAVRRFA